MREDVRRSLRGISRAPDNSYRLQTPDNLDKPQTPESKVVSLQNKTLNLLLIDPANS